MTIYMWRFHCLQSRQKANLILVKTNSNKNHSNNFNQNKTLKLKLSGLSKKVNTTVLFIKLASLQLLETSISTFYSITIGEQYAGN